MSVKLKRIGSEIAKILSEIILEESRDTILKTITITDVEVAGDLGSAKVYFTSLSDLSKEQLEKELKEASGFLRKELSERIDIRHTPQLRFVYDESIAYGQKIENILKDIKKDN